MPEIVAGLAEHAALLRERQRAARERERQQREAEARRRREESFGAREKRRLEFVDVVHEQLLERSKLSAVLAHLETAMAEDANRAQSMPAWIRRRIRQIDALTSPEFLDLSARSAKLGFVEPLSDPDSEEPGGYYGYLSTPRLQFWSIDEEKELATSISSLEWAVQAGLVPEKSDDTPGAKLVDPRDRRSAELPMPSFVRDPTTPSKAIEQVHILEAQPPMRTFSSGCDLIEGFRPSAESVLRLHVPKPRFARRLGQT